MLKVLLKKQLLESLCAMTRRSSLKNKKPGNAAAKPGIFLYLLLILYIGGIFGFLFYQMMDTLCEPLVNAGLAWLYFALAGSAAMALGVIGSVFATQHQLFEAKDNEFLLSMPIPPLKILLSRMLVLYINTFLFEAVIFVPAIIKWAQMSSLNPTELIFAAVILLIQPLLALTLSCILGWLVALISSRMRNKSLITIILSLLFIAGYYYIYFKINDLLSLILANAAKVGRTVKAALYPLYQMGNAMTGDSVSFIIFLAIVIGAFGITCFVLAATFLKVALTKRSAKKAKYQEKTLKVSNIRTALFKRELIHLSKNPVYMLNCALGTLLMVLGAVFIIIKSSMIKDFIASIPFASNLLAPMMCLAICFIASANMLTTPSISIEGKSLWLLQSFPIPGWTVLKSKLSLHIVLTGIPALLCSSVIAAIFKFNALMTVLLFVTPIVYILLSAVVGLIINLRFPMLNWSSEAVAIKQSTSPLLSMLFNWSILGLSVALYFLTDNFLNQDIYLLLITVIWAILALLLMYRLKTKGAKKFAALS